MITLIQLKLRDILVNLLGRKLMYREQFCKPSYSHLFLLFISACLVHGPLTLTLLLDLMRDNLPNKISYIKSFAYRAVSPLFVGEEFKICGKKSESDSPSGSSYELWAENKRGGIAMKGNAIIENI